MRPLIVLLVATHLCYALLLCVPRRVQGSNWAQLGGLQRQNQVRQKRAPFQERWGHSITPLVSDVLLRPFSYVPDSSGQKSLRDPEIGICPDPKGYQKKYEEMIQAFKENKNNYRVNQDIRFVFFGGDSYDNEIGEG